MSRSHPNLRNCSKWSQHRKGWEPRLQSVILELITFGNALIHSVFVYLYNSPPLFCRVAFCDSHRSQKVFIHALEGICGVSWAWLLRLTLLWEFAQQLFRGLKLSFLWDRCPRVQLLGHMVLVCLVFFLIKESAKLIFQNTLPFAFPPVVSEGSDFQTLSSAFCGVAFQ